MKTIPYAYNPLARRLGRRGHLTPVAALGLLLGTATVAFAQGGEDQHGAASDAARAGNSYVDAGKIEEVTVTAERRKTNLQKTPVAVTVLNAADLRRDGEYNLRDLAANVPNVYMSAYSLTPSTEVINIRGIGTNDPTADSAVATYIDDVYLPRSFGSSLVDLPDLQQVEVLRGPQGTLYGANSDGGAVRFITSDPTDQTRIILDAGAGNYGAFKSDGLISGAILPGKLDASLAYAHTQHDGFLHDPTLNSDLDDLDSDEFRAKLRFTPTDNLEAVLAVDGLRDRSDVPYFSPIAETVPVFNGHGIVPTTITVPNDPSQTDSALEPVQNLDSGGVSLHITDKLNDKITLKSITSAHLFSQVPGLYDIGGFANPTYLSEVKYRDHDYTQELQALGDFGRLNVVGGLFYLHEYFGVTRTSLVFPIFGFTPARDLAAFSVENAQVTDNEAAYAQASYKILPKLTATLGGRFTHVHRSFVESDYNDTVAGTTTTLNFSSSASDSWNSLTPKFALEYQWTPQLMQYFSVSQGFRSGGYDSRASTIAVAETPYAPETVTSYEVGLKSKWFDGRALADLALFRNDYSNFQANTITNAISQLKNAGSATTEGAELETTIKPASGLQWSNSAGYEYAVYNTFINPTGNGTSAAGNGLPTAPRWQFDSTISYFLPLPIPGTVKAVGNVTFRTKVWGDVTNDPLQELPAQRLFNASLNYTSPKGRWTGTFSIRNIGDDRKSQYSTHINVGPYKIINDLPTPPRTFFVSIGYRF